MGLARAGDPFPEEPNHPYIRPALVSALPHHPTEMYYLLECTILPALLLMPQKMNIFLRSCVKEEPMQLLECEQFEKISELRKKVMEKYLWLPRMKFVLKFRGKELTDYDTSGWNAHFSQNSVCGYGISNGSIIECYCSKPS